MALDLHPRLRGYEIEAAIGRTPIALVHRAHRHSPRRAVLVKFLASVPAGLGASARIATELAAIAALRHPNAIHVEDWGEADGVFYVVTEGEPEDSLAELLAEGVRFDRATAVTLLECVAAAIDEAHMAGVSHGSLEPSVIRLTADGMPLVADFGLARLSNASPVPGSGGVRFGSTAYVAPERAVGDPVGPAADVYSFAAIAYELLTGTAPFADPGTSAIQQLYAHVNHPPPPPTQRDATLPAEVDGILLLGLAKDPTRRWASCGELVDALAGVLAPATRPAVGRRRRWPTLALRLAAAAVLPLAIAALVVVRPRLDAATAERRPSAAPTTVAAEPSVAPSAVPTALPSAGPTAPAATAAPAGPPTPTALPTPAPPRPGQAIRLGASSIGRGDALVVTGSGFDPAGKYSIDVVQEQTSYEVQPDTQVPANGAFSVRVFIPGQARPGPATIVACGTSATGQNCVQARVTIT